MNGLAPDIQRIDYGQGDRTRPSASASLQWRPAAGLEFYVDALYQGFRNKVSDRDLTVPLWGGTASNPVLNSTGRAALFRRRQAHRKIRSIR